MKKELKDVARFMLSQFFIITVCVMFVITAANTLFSGGFNYPIDGSFPWVMMLTGFLGSLPSCLFYFKEEPSKKKFYLRMLLHYLVLNAVILGEGRLLRWYSGFSEMLVIAASILTVYLLVWVFSLISQTNTSRSINKALEEFNVDEENN